jgi:hypothetical protein
MLHQLAVAAYINKKEEKAVEHLVEHVVCRPVFVPDSPVKKETKPCSERRGWNKAVAAGDQGYKLAVG